MIEGKVKHAGETKNTEVEVNMVSTRLCFRCVWMCTLMRLCIFLACMEEGKEDFNRFYLKRKEGKGRKWMDGWTEGKMDEWMERRMELR